MTALLVLAVVLVFVVADAAGVFAQAAVVLSGCYLLLLVAGIAGGRRR